MAGRQKGCGSNWIKPAKRLAIYSRDGFCCAFCGASAEAGTILTLDHVLACELGGTNEATNLVTACLSCNSSKQALSMTDWLQRIADRGVDTALVPARIRRLTGTAPDLAEGKRLLAARQAAKA